MGSNVSLFAERCQVDYCLTHLIAKLPGSISKIDSLFFATVQILHAMFIHAKRRSNSWFFTRIQTPIKYLKIMFHFFTVARGEILSVSPSSKRKGMDNLHIRSNLLIHQNYAVFQPLKSGNKNLQKLLLQETSTFDQDSPIKMKSSKPGKSSFFGGVISHPSKCAAQNGPGQFLWLIKLSFGRPKIGCVVYWDRWISLAKDADKSGSASCALVYQ